MMNEVVDGERLNEVDVPVHGGGEKAETDDFFC